MNKSIISTIFLGVLSVCAHAGETDTLRAHHLRPLEVMGIKQTPDGGSAVEAVTRIDRAQINILRIESPKDVALIAPN